jgi:hypothetical protein
MVIKALQRLTKGDHQEGGEDNKDFNSHHNDGIRYEKL